MRRINITALIVLWLTWGCKQVIEKSDTTYIEDANNLILQLLSENSCNCLLEVPTSTVIEINNSETPYRDIKNILKRNLLINNASKLDSLAELSSTFILNKKLLAEHQIQVISRDLYYRMLTNQDSDLEKICPNGLWIIYKPIINKQMNIAVIKIDHAMGVYKYNKGKWKSVN